MESCLDCKAFRRTYQEMVRIALQTHQVQLPDSVDPLIAKGEFLRGESEKGTPVPFSETRWNCCCIGSSGI